jgi:hypothetical protein
VLFLRRDNRDAALHMDAVDITRRVAYHDALAIAGPA